jgi:hypothetical protein
MGFDFINRVVVELTGAKYMYIVNELNRAVLCLYNHIVAVLRKGMLAHSKDSWVDVVLKVLSVCVRDCPELRTDYLTNDQLEWAAKIAEYYFDLNPSGMKPKTCFTVETLSARVNCVKDYSVEFVAKVFRVYMMHHPPHWVVRDLKVISQIEVKDDG